VLRQQRELDDALNIERADPRLHDVLRLGAYQLRWLTRVPSHAAVSTSVELARETVGEASTGYVNQLLRKLANRDVGEATRDAPSSHPDWLVQRWTARYGPAETEQLVSWNDARPALVLQPARWDVERLQHALTAEGIETEPAPFDAGLQLRISRPPSRIPGFAEGAFIVQDPAHALVCRFAAIPRGSLVYDGCAAPGGKAVTLEAMGARVFAGDVRRERMVRLRETISRAGVAIRTLTADLVAAPLRPASVDAVLVDAPCTATGTMRRHPDARWRLTPDVFARSAARQARLLEAAAALVRPGGLLIYATCSLEPEENVQVVEAFLKRHAEFSRAVTTAVASDLLTAAGDFESLPQRHGIDGAYAARLARRS
jgi:16S rRNA (cytosine967-C5)-methyltransferase